MNKVQIEYDSKSHATDVAIHFIVINVVANGGLCSFEFRACGKNGA